MLFNIQIMSFELKKGVLWNIQRTAYCNNTWVILLKTSQSRLKLDAEFNLIPSNSYQGCYLTSPSDYLNQRWPLISDILWHLSRALWVIRRYCNRLWIFCGDYAFRVFNRHPRGKRDIVEDQSKAKLLPPMCTKTFIYDILYCLK